MSAPAIKPLGRCACRDCASPTHVYMQAPNGRERCPNDAVRMVTVRVPWRDANGDSGVSPATRSMCAPCAAHAEGEGTK